MGFATPIEESASQPASSKHACSTPTAEQVHTDCAERSVIVEIEYHTSVRSNSPVRLNFSPKFRLKTALHACRRTAAAAAVDNIMDQTKRLDMMNVHEYFSSGFISCNFRLQLD